MNRIGMKVLAVAMVLMMALSSAMAAARTRVRFKPGQNSATVTGKIGTNGAKTYVLRASKGQTLTATLSSTNGKVDFTQANVHDTQYSITVENTGDVEVMIDNHGGPTNYTLTVSIQ
jgi:urease beta subunit